MYKTDERCHEKINRNYILLVIFSLPICLFISYKDSPVRRKKTRSFIKATEYEDILVNRRLSPVYRRFIAGYRRFIAEKYLLGSWQILLVIVRRLYYGTRSELYRDTGCCKFCTAQIFTSILLSTVMICVKWFIILFDEKFI